MSIATSLKQSKKLLSLGIKPDTADMYLAINVRVLIAAPYIDYFSNGDKALPCVDATPAWSLSALLSLMPAGTQLLTSYDDNDCLVYTFAIAGLMDTDDYTNPIDAAVEMIEWLVTNKYLKV